MNIIVRRLAITAMLLALLAAAAPAPLRAAQLVGLGPRDPQELGAFLDTFFRDQLEREHIAGAAVSVVKDGELLVARGYGYADLAARAPVVAEQTLFATGSTGKLFTWVAVMQLVEQGLLDLDADVNTYLTFTIPATYPEPITLRHLLSHTAGFDNLPGIYARDPHELVSAGLYLSTHIPERVRAPGELAAYSNYGAALAGHIVEEVTHTPFARYAEQHILAPLGMASTSLRQPLPADLAARASVGYSYTGGQLRAAPQRYIRLPAAGESYATATDMARLMVALLQRGSYGEVRILSEATGGQMQQQLFTHDPRVNGMAYGMAEARLGGERILKHNGVFATSFNSIVALLPERGVGIYASYNSNGGFAQGEELLQAFIDHYYPTDTVTPTPLADAPQVAARMAGTYRTSNSFARSFAKLLALLPGSGYGDIQLIAASDGSVTSVGLGPQRLRWVPVAPDVLCLADGRHDPYGDLVFGTDAAGGPDRLFIENNPFRAYDRVPWYETGGFALGLFAACGLIFVSAIAGWPITAFINRGRRASSAHRLSIQLAGGAIALYLLFLPMIILVAPEAISVGAEGGLRAAMRTVLCLPLLGGALLLGSALTAVRAWGLAGWSRLGRAHYLLVLLAGVGYLWFLNTWNLLGFRI
ncbi:beta-lactamase family protein [Chloroflexales bacterium ZM16-3]|nr:beta-lactamase family protein [Chloroflexales bacterium ZM16-3]